MTLQLLSDKDPLCILIVRRINKLGVRPVEKLQRYFSQFGRVINILVAHSTVRQDQNPSCLRHRPSSLGFVHMATQEAVTKALSLGEERLVERTPIKVQKFVRQQFGKGKTADAQALQGYNGQQDTEWTSSSHEGVSDSSSSGAML
jgi:hypothetical protein